MADRDLQIREGPVTLTPRWGGGLKQKIFLPFGPQFGLKITGGGWPPLGPSPGSATGDSQHFVTPPRAEIPC